MDELKGNRFCLAEDIPLLMTEAFFRALAASIEARALKREALNG